MNDYDWNLKCTLYYVGYLNTYINTYICYWRKILKMIFNIIMHTLPVITICFVTTYKKIKIEKHLLYYKTYPRSNLIEISKWHCAHADHEPW